MKAIRSYVIRIYRRDRDALVGVVEDVEGGRTAAFQSELDLGALLAGRQPFPRRTRRRGRRPGVDAGTPADDPAARDTFSRPHHQETLP